jgi:hypothetical protein
MSEPSAPSELSDEELPDSYWRRWYVFAFWSGPLILMLLVGIVGAIGIPGGPELLIIIITIGTLLAIPLGFWAFFGYMWDASVLKDSNSDWVPLWWLWMIGHFLLTPLITAPIYLVLRTTRTGFPWENGYTIR